MKRTNLVLNEQYLEDATRLLGAKTYSEAVNKALEQTIKLYHLRQLADVTGTGLWEGDLGVMREDVRSSKDVLKSKKKTKTKRKG